MSEMPEKLAVEIALVSLQPHFSVVLTETSIISSGLRKLGDEQLRTIKQDTEDLALEEGYGTRIPFHRLKQVFYHRAINYADKIYSQSWKLPAKKNLPSTNMTQA